MFTIVLISKPILFTNLLKPFERMAFVYKET